MQKGIYCLILSLAESKDIRIGALGTIAFQSGWYVYVGSALGSGGLSRVSRHIRFYREHYRKPKWHIDYLMEVASLEKTVCAETNERLECVLAKAILDALGDCGARPRYISRFGCSDCDCPSHLFYFEHEPTKEIVSAFVKMELEAVEHEVKGV